MNPIRNKHIAYIKAKKILQKTRRMVTVLSHGQHFTKKQSSYQLNGLSFRSTGPSVRLQFFRAIWSTYSMDTEVWLTIWIHLSGQRPQTNLVILDSCRGLRPDPECEFCVDAKLKKALLYMWANRNYERSCLTYLCRWSVVLSIYFRFFLGSWFCFLPNPDIKNYDTFGRERGHNFGF